MCLCLALGPQPADGTNDASNSMTMMIMMAWLVIAAALFMLRPSSMRHQADPKGRSGNVSNNRNIFYQLLQSLSLLVVGFYSLDNSASILYLF